MNCPDSSNEMSKDEWDAADVILERAEAMNINCHREKLGLLMDLSTATEKHALDIIALSKCGGDDFTHDILGIQKHLNRETGELEDCFIPRFTKP
jgi:hypothetical protein